MFSIHLNYAQSWKGTTPLMLTYPFHHLSMQVAIEHAVQGLHAQVKGTGEEAGLGTAAKEVAATGAVAAALARRRSALRPASQVTGQAVHWNHACTIKEW